MSTLNVINKTGDVQSQDGKQWFYTEKVKDHFFNPKNIFKTQEEASEYATKASGIGLVGSPACGDGMKMFILVDPNTDKIVECKWQTYGSLLPGAKIMMNDFSEKPVEKLNTADKILDGEGKINLVEKVISKKYSGKVLTFKLSATNHYTITVTPNHPIPCIPRSKVSLVQRSSGKRWSEVSNKKVQSAESNLVSAVNIKEGDFFLFNIPSYEKDLSHFTPELCTLLGYYVSDGYIISKKVVKFSFNVTQQNFIEEIKELSRKNSWDCVVYKRKSENVIDVKLNNQDLVEFLKIHGGAPRKKGFSVEIMNLPPKKQMKIIDAYINGDGWKTQQNENWNAQYFISSSRMKIINQLQIMLARNNFFAPISKRPERDFVINGKTYRNKGEINLSFKKKKSYSRIKLNQKENCFLIPVSKIEVSDYEGTIYDFGLKDAPNTYRVNGITIHNCGTAIASTSIFSEMITRDGGMKIDDALAIKPKHIADELGGIPPRKFHCSVLADKAFKEAVNDYFEKTNQPERIVAGKAKVLDKVLKITDHDIEHAVLEGALTFEAVQKKTKVGVHDKECIPKVKELIEFYKNKYF